MSWRCCQRPELDWPTLRARKPRGRPERNSWRKPGEIQTHHIYKYWPDVLICNQKYGKAYKVAYIINCSSLCAADGWPLCRSAESSERQESTFRRRGRRREESTTTLKSPSKRSPHLYVFSSVFNQHIIGAQLKVFIHFLSHFLHFKGFYDTSMEQYNALEPNFKRLRQQHLDGELRKSVTLYITFYTHTVQFLFFIHYSLTILLCVCLQ